MNLPIDTTMEVVTIITLSARAALYWDSFWDG